MEENKKTRLSSTVVVPQSFRRRSRERNRSPKESDRHRTQSNNREPRKQDDNRDSRQDRSPRKRSTERDNDNDSRDNKQRRSWQNERVPARERLSFPPRNKPAHLEIITDPCDVPKGKRYFEHDNREGFDNQNFNTMNRGRRNFPRQRSRSPTWKHDRFADSERQNRRERQRPTSWRQRVRNPRSPVWKHDKFEEMESQENMLKDDDKDTNEERRGSTEKS